MLMTLPSLLALGDLGFGGAAVIRVTMEVARGEMTAARATMQSAAQVLGIACLSLFTFASAVAVAMPDSFLPRIDGESLTDLRFCIVILAAYACVVLGAALLHAVFRSTGRFAHAVGFSTAAFVLENTFLIGAIMLDQGLLLGAIALTAGRVLGMIAYLIAAIRLRTGLLPGRRPGSAATRRELLKPALSIMMIPLATALLLQGTVAGLGAAAGAAAVPAFVAARTLSRLGLQVTQMLTGALSPEFGGAAAQGQHGRVLKLAIVLGCVATVVALPFAALLALVGPWIVLHWSNGKIHAEPAMMAAIAVSALCGAIWKPLSDLMLAQQRQGAFAPAYAVLAAGGVAFTILAGKTFGSLAPAMALALVDLAMVLLVLRFARTNWATLGDSRHVLQELRGEIYQYAAKLSGRFRSL